ncbi:MAG: Holliday junction branch migration DNA helicase RuvB [bacterium]
MNPEDSLLSPITGSEEEPLERSLRPDSFSDYVGQSSVKESLRIAIESAKKRHTTVDHVLLYGPPGLGKTSLAHLIAKEMGGNLRTTSGPVISKAGDLAAILTNLQEGDILFIDEIHRMQRSIEEILYPAMEDGCLDIMLGKGPSARSLRLDLPAFTLVGATTRAGALSQPLRERFGLLHRLDYYEEEDLAAILDRSSRLLNMDITQPALLHLAGRARRTPRVANRLLRRLRDFALVKNHDHIGIEEVELALRQLQIDHLGLDKTDRQLLTIMHTQFSGGPVGLDTLAAATGEEAATIEDVIEPFLLRLGLLDRTPRGRILTEAATRHLAVDGLS